MSFIEEMDEIKSEFDESIEVRRKAYEDLVTKKREGMFRLLDDNFLKLRSRGSTGDEIIDALLRRHIYFNSSMIPIIPEVLKATEQTAKERKEGTVLPIILDDTDKIIELIEHNLDLRKKLEAHREKYIAVQYRTWMPSTDLISFYITPRRPFDPARDTGYVGMLGKIAEDGNVMYVDNKGFIFINTGGERADIVKGKIPYKKEPHIIRSDIPYLKLVDYQIPYEGHTGYFAEMRNLFEAGVDAEDMSV